jgi:hypothetical protein
MNRFRPWNNGIGPNDIRCDECGMWYNQSCSSCEYCGGPKELEDDIEEDEE